MAVKKTFEEAIQQLIDVNDMVINNKISPEKARAIAQNMQVVINAAKLQIDYMKLTKKNNAEFFKMEDAMKLPPIDETLKEIEQNQSKPYEFSK